jgi:hypothetical protein
MYKIDNFNREIIIERYVSDIVGSLHFLETKEMLKDLLIDRKRALSDDDLEMEIMRHDPALISDIYMEELMEEVTHA